jgi:hypothetical protein
MILPRVYTIEKEVQGDTIPENDRPQYFCTRCKSEYKILQILDSVDHSLMGAFVCKKCRFSLSPVTKDNHGEHEQSSQMSQQFKFITDMLPKIDSVVVPGNNFEVALASALKVQRDATHPANESAPQRLLSRWRASTRFRVAKPETFIETTGRGEELQIYLKNVISSVSFVSVSHITQVSIVDDEPASAVESHKKAIEAYTKSEWEWWPMQQARRTQ